eukprot:12009090-Karenia_brevis.AAC.1
MAFKSIAKEAKPEASQEWTDILGVPPRMSPVPVFRTGTFRGKSFQDGVTQFPEHYIQSKRKRGPLPAETKDFVQWVDTHFEADGKVLNWRTVAAPAQASITRDRSKCIHQN